jgi:hypothetical protein
VLDANRASGLSQRDRPLDFVAELSHVPWPPVLDEQVERFTAKVNVRLVEPLRGFPQEQTAQVGNFLTALAQWRDVDPDDTEAIIQIFSEPTLGDALLEVGVGGGDHPNVHTLGPRVADRHDFALLEKTQKLWLHVKGDVANFVEKQSATCGRSNQSRLIGDRSGKATSAMAEQLTVGQLACGCRAVEGEEQGRCAGRSHVDRSCHELLARPTLPGDEHGEIVPLETLNLLGHALHDGAGAEKAWQERLERALVTGRRHDHAALTRRAKLEPLSGYGSHHPQSPS